MDREQLKLFPPASSAVENPRKSIANPSKRGRGDTETCPLCGLHPFLCWCPQTQGPDDSQGETKTRYRYAWKPRGLRTLDRHGQTCKVIARGKMNSALIEFADGQRAIISRNALRKETP